MMTDVGRTFYHDAERVIDTIDTLHAPVMDLHAHTWYSRCGVDAPEKLVEAAIAGGIDIFGISDHNHGICDRIEQYRTELEALRERYKDRIRLLIGMEIASIPEINFTQPERLQGFDYCLLENLDLPTSTVGADGLLEYRSAFPCKFGIAHTDLVALARSRGEDPLVFLRTLAEHDIFWEMNVSYDSIHHFREHAYWKRFMEDPEERKMVRDSGIALSVGFDGHRVNEYKPERVIAMNRFLQEEHFTMVTFDAPNGTEAKS